MTLEARANDTTGKKQAESQLEAVWKIMCDRQWHTLSEIAEITGCPQASASARLRDLRKPEFGGRQIERQYVHRGLWRYRVADTQQASTGKDSDSPSPAAVMCEAGA